MILDTNALSAFVDGDRKLAIALREQLVLSIPVIVLGEYRYGIAGSRSHALYEAWMARYLRQFEVLDITAATAGAYATLRAELKAAGTPIPTNDAWIAALALQFRRPLVSRDAHFDHVRGLRRVAW